MTVKPADRDFDALFADPSTRARAARGVSIRLSGLTRRFGELEVLRGIDLDIAAGRFVAIVGRSGCGKSTLLRLLSGLDRPSGGELAFGAGEDDDVVPRLMFQEPRLLPWARVVDNVAVGLGRDRDAPDGRLRVASALAAVGLAEKAEAWPAVLSGGQKQRVALARALVSRPRFLALDEPLGALDALTRIGMQSLLERVWLAQGFTAVLVTHDVGEAIALADRVVMIEEGRVALDVAVDLPRPRRRGSAEAARLEAEILRHLVHEEPPDVGWVI
ncbi:ATP-binding cassette domain-containing protein [Pinisolibacter aquiterrae]|uniref:ATP-binding cassette domain-containing protein n=1 Tax=Pinisolibacter aquiterrae TaxID=2815579 RepID=UPI001C3D53DE|nr:ATP-binding cassette domain-containing protein [Pinisolibacter aquiterrae]MBV5264889.1 ATP-binding cassette domain-containing protein [Pinisolibacter aquiterrae]MCC8234308.1 ATP-binding cassette domain-containing protein [Pinisolibacter aquiterrae]